MDELQKLYNVLSRDGYYTKSFEDFQVQYEDPSYREKVFGVVSRDGLFTKSREDFEQKYSPLKKKEDAEDMASTLEDGSSESSPIEQRPADFAAKQRSDQRVRQALGLEEQPEQPQEQRVADVGGMQFSVPTEGIAVFNNKGQDVSDPVVVAAREGKLTTAQDPKDVRGDDYVDPVDALFTASSLSSEGYPSPTRVKAAEEQRAKDREYTEAVIVDAQPALDKVREQEEAASELARVEEEAERREFQMLPEVQESLDGLTVDEFTSTPKAKAMKNLNKEYGKYGLVFFDNSFFDNEIKVNAPDGSTMVIAVNAMGYPKADQLEQLKTFVLENGKTLEGVVYGDEEAGDKRAWRAQSMREIGRLNEDGSMSTVLFESAEIDGKNVVYPTLFPKNPDDYASHPAYWTELEGMEAYEEALKRGEVFTFETSEGANEFAEGSWKDVNAVDVMAEEFFAERGADYNSYKANRNAYYDAREELNFLEVAPLYEESLTPEQRSKYGERYYINGTRRNDYQDSMRTLQSTVDMLVDVAMDDDLRTLQEDFDAETNKVFKKKTVEAVEINNSAKGYVEQLNTMAEDLMGMTAEEVAMADPSTISPAFASQAKQIRDGYVDAQNLSQMAANQYQVAQTWFNNQFDKNIRGELLENYAGFTEAVSNGYARGQAAEEILKITLGLVDLDDDASLESVANAVVGYMEQAQGSGNTNRTLNRYHQARGFVEIFEVFKDDPMELALTLAGESMSQMLPYGVKLVGGGAVTGGGIGAGVGALGGGVGAVPGAIAGAGYGARTGFAATSLAMEYTNAVLDAMRSRGYDITDPKAVAVGFQDESVWDEGREIGLKRGIPIAIVDYLSSGLAGRVFTTGKLAARPVRTASFVGERFAFDPAAEAFGEATAQVVAGQDLDGKEIFSEALGAIGNNAPFAVMNQTFDAIANNKLQLAQDLMNINGMAAEGASDVKISEWSNNMEKLGQITAEQNQRIQENVGLRRDARNLLGPVGNATLEQRVMELMAAKKELESTPNRKSVFGEKIAQINREIASIVENGQMLPEEQQTVLAGIGVIEVGEQQAPTDVRTGIAAYMLNGKQVTKEAFIAEVNKMSNRRLLRLQAKIDNDEEMASFVKEKIKQAENAIQEPSTAQVDVQQPPAPSPTVREGDTEGVAPAEAGVETVEVTEETTEEERVAQREAGIERLREELKDESLSEDEYVAKNRELRKLLWDKSTGEFELAKEALPSVLAEAEKIVNEVRKRQGLPSVSEENPMTQKELTGTESVAPELTREEVPTEVTPTEETVSSRTQEEQEALDQEVQDLEALFGQDTGPLFQLGLEGRATERQARLEESAMQLMDEVQPEIVSETTTIEAPTVETIPVTVTENQELANKVPKMGLADLAGRKVNYLMADQLKVSEDLMGGPFFPLMEDTFGKVAWASMDERAAKAIVEGAKKGDYSVVYNMSPQAVDSNQAVFQEFINTVNQSEQSQQAFATMMEHLQTLRFDKAAGVDTVTNKVHRIAKEATSFDNFLELMQELDVDTKADIIKKTLPTRNKKSQTEIGILLEGMDITQESVRENISEQFARDLPMGALTMVLEVTDSSGNKVTADTDINDVLMTREQQEAEGIRTHPNYPVYIRGRAVAMLEDTLPFWNVDKAARSGINAKVAGVVQGKTAPFTASQARSAEMRRTSMQAATAKTVTEATDTQYQQFVNRLSKAFPNTEVVTDQAAFDELLTDLNAQQLVTKNQKVYGAVLNGKLYLNPALENYNTPVHEFGHLWMNIAKELQPEAYQQGLNLVEGTEYVTQVENNKAYQKIIKQMRAEGATEAEIQQYILEEALATAIGDKGESFASAAQKRNFKNWLNELFEFIKQLTGISELTTEQIQDLNFDEFLNAVVTDLLSENEIFAEAEVENFGNDLQLMASEDVTIQEIVQRGRQANFSDAAIRALLRNRGFKAENINEAMEVRIDIETPLPPEFARVEGGVQEATQLFNEVRDAVAAFARGTQRRTRRPRMTNQEREARIAELREQNPTLTELSDAALLRRFPRPAQQQEVEVTRPTMSEVRAEALRLLRENPIFQAQPEQVQLELISSFDRTLNTQANRTVQREVTDIRRILRQRKIGAQNLKRAQIMLKNFVRQNLQKSRTYTQADINKIVRAITNIKTIDDFYAQADNVMGVVERQRAKMKKRTLTEILSLARKKAKTGQTSTRKRRTKGLDPDGQSLMRAIAKAASRLINVKPVVAQRFLAEEQAFLEENEAEINRILNKELLEGEQLTTKERDLLNRQVAFDMMRDVDTMTLEDAEALLGTLKDFRKESIRRLKERRAGRAAEYEAVREETTAQIQETNPDLFDEEGNVLSDNEREGKREEIFRLFRERKIPEAMREFVRVFKDTSLPKLISDTVRNKLQNLETLSNLADKAIEGKNAFRENVYNRLNRMNENHLRGKRRVRGIMNDIAVEAGFENGYEGVKRAMARGFFKEAVVTLELTNSKTGRKFNKSFNIDQLLRVYALSLNDVQRAKLEAQGIDAAALESIKAELGPELVAFADGIVNFFSETYYEEVNTVYSDVNDVNLGYVPNYFPTRTERSKVDGKMLDDGDFNGIFSAETAPALKEREDTTGDVKFDASFTGVLENHIDTMEKFKAYAKGVRMMNTFFDIPAVNALIEELNIKGVMKQLINNSINPNAGVQATGMKTLLDKLLTKYTGFALAFKLMQIPKQASSFINAYADYRYFPKDSNVPKAVQAVLDPLMFMMDTATLIANLGVEVFTKDGPMSKAREMSATFDDRVRQGLEGDVYGLESGSKPFRRVRTAQTAVGRARRGIRKAAGSPTAIGDIGGVMGYLVNYRRNIKNGMSNAQAVEAFNNYNATQQSRRGSERIPLQNSNSGLVRTFTMFGSVLFLQMNKAMQAAKNMMDTGFKGMITGKGRAKDARELVLNVSAANVMFTTMSNIMLLTRGDDDDREKAMIRIAEAMMGLNLLYQIPILGTELEKMEIGARLIQGEDFKPDYGRKFSKDGVNPLSSIVLQVKRALKPDEKTGKIEVAKVIEPIIELIMGTQVDPAVGLHNILGGGSEEGIENDIYDLIGVSSSYRPSGDADKGTAKPPKSTMSKRDMKQFAPELYEEVYGTVDEVMKDVTSESKAISKEVRDIKKEAMREAMQ